MHLSSVFLISLALSLDLTTSLPLPAEFYIQRHKISLVPDIYLIFKIMTAFRKHSSPIASCLPPTANQENIGSRMLMETNHLDAVTLNTYLTRKTLLLNAGRQNIMFIIYWKCFVELILIIQVRHYFSSCSIL